MNKFYASVFFVLFTAIATSAPLTGTKTIKAAGGDYASFNAAFTDLNANGVGAGGVIFNVDADFASVEDPGALTATGTAANQIVFQKSGSGANPVVKPGGGVGTTDFSIKIAGGDYITFNGIDIAINVGSAVEWGYVLEGSATNGCQNNMIMNCSITLSKANTASRGIYSYFAIAPTALIYANSYNKYFNNNIQNVYNGYVITGNSSFPDQGNEIGTIDGGTSTLTNLGGGTSTCSAISVSNQNLLKIFNQNITNINTTTGQINGILHSGTATSASIYNNTISNLGSTTTATNTVYGMSFTSTNNVTVYDNAITNIAATTGPAAGINASGSGTSPRLTFYNNTIQQISSSGTSAINSAFGFNNSGAGVTMNFYRNTITNIENKAGGTAGVATGVSISGTTCNVYNNFISDVKMTAGTAAAGVRGLSLVGGTSNFYVFHNSVYLDYTPSAPTASGTALHLAASANSIDIRNNIFVNKMNNASGARSVAMYAAGINYLNKFATLADNNLYYAGTPTATNLIYYDGTNSDQTITAYKNRIATKDQHSITELPPFISTVSPYNLHLNTAIATQCEKGGLAITKPFSVDRDIDGNLRDLNYTDIGADEGSFTWLDQMGPYINYTPLNKTTFFTARTLTATIHDPSGVPTTGAGLPVLYWKFNAAASFTPVTGTFVSGSTYTFVFGGGATLNDSVTYYVAAQDIAPAVNVLAYPSAGAGGYTSSVPAAATPPATPSTYKVVTPIAETLLVGTGQSYTSLTGVAPGGLFAALKDAVIVRNLEIRITSDLVETGAVDLTQWLEEGDGNYTVTFSPNSPTKKIISSGTLAGSAIIRLNGVKRAVFNGSFNETGNYLTFRDKEDFTPVFFFQNDATGNMITNCTVEGINTSTQLGLIHFTNGILTGCDSNTVSNCIIRDRSDAVGKPQNLIHSEVNALTTPGIYNSDNNIINNKMFNFNSNGFYSVGLNENWTISGNEIYDTLAGGTAVFGINLGSQGNNTITQNNIHDLKFTAGGAVAGILIQSATNVSISKNKIYNFPATSGKLIGIAFWGSGAGGASATAVNNQITIIPAGNTDQSIVGIWDNASTGNTLNTYNNTVLIGGNSTTTNNSWAYQRQPISGATNNTIRNNIFYNDRAGSGSNNFALGDEKFGAGQFTISNNLYVGTGATDINFMDRSASGTTAESFEAWVAATHDISSYAVTASTINPGVLFTDVAIGNLDINTSSDMCWYANGKALPLTGIADDFGGNAVRSTTLAGGSADIGSDEFNTTTLPPVLAVTGVHAPGGSESFSFGGRTLATINWGAASTTLPSLGVLRHYTGVWPNDLTNNGTVTGARTLNEWWDIPATGGSSFTYNISLSYDSAMQGNVLNEGTMIFNKKQSAVAGTWALVNPTTVDSYNKVMSATGISSFSEFTGTDFDHNLPVSLLSFNAIAQRNDVVLQWTTAAEINNRSFELERSLDGSNFTSFANVNGAGNSNTVNRYSLLDAAALTNFKNADRIYYRLKMNSTNGHVMYSQIVIIKPGKLHGELVQAVMPNPFVSHINISLNLPEAGTVNARLIDMSGKQLINTKYKSNTGYSTIEITNLDHLSKGIYVLELRYGKEIITRKVVKE
jgi:Secretion system C-terminal sorting domain